MIIPMKRILLFPVFFFATAIFYPCLAVETFDDIKIDVIKFADGKACHGYFEYFITIENTSATKAHKVRIVFPKKRSYGSKFFITRSFDLPPESEVSAAMFQPPVEIYGNKAAVYIDGANRPEFIRFPEKRHCGWICKRDRKNVFLILMANIDSSDDMAGPAKKIKELLLKRAYKERKSAGKSRKYKSGDLELVIPFFEPEQWSKNWLGYSRFEGVILTKSRISAMPDSVREALFSYVRCGGTLLILGDYISPDFYPEKNAEIPRGISLYSMGFGYCFVLKNPGHAGLFTDQEKFLFTMWRKTLSPWKEKKTLMDANKEFPIVENLGIDLEGFFICMIVFIIIVGPLNFLFLSKINRRIWIVWTIPLISILTCAIVFAYVFISDGIGSDVRISAFTVLDETNHMAATLARYAFYCRLTPEKGLNFSRKTELIPFLSDRMLNRDSPRLMDWTFYQHLGAGWISARVPAHFMTRKTEKRRERLEINRISGSKITVMNGFGVAIKKLWLADKNGKIFYGENIGPWEKRILTPTNNTEKKGPNFPKLVYESLSWENMIKLPKKNILRPGTYMCHLDGLPFTEKGLENIDKLKFNQIVYGIIR